MTWNKVCSLISETYTTDSIGQQIAAQTETTVFCALKSVSMQEMTTAAQLKLKPSICFVVKQCDYDCQVKVVYNDIQYTVYRTYFADNENIELYCEKRAGK